MNIKYYNIFTVLIVLYAFSLNAGKHSNIGRRAAALTDIYFCAKMSNGEQISNGVDDYLWTVLGCDEVIERAFSVGCSEDDIVKEIEKAKKIIKNVRNHSIKKESNDNAIDWDAFKKNLEIASEKAVIATDLHFCIKMSNGEEISNGVDNFLWEGMGCDKIVKRAFELGFTKEEVVEIINEAQKIEMLKNNSVESSFDLEGFQQELQASLKRGREEFEQKYSGEIKEIHESSEEIVKMYKQHGFLD